MAPTSWVRLFLSILLLHPVAWGSRLAYESVADTDVVAAPAARPAGADWRRLSTWTPHAADAILSGTSQPIDLFTRESGHTLDVVSPADEAERRLDWAADSDFSTPAGLMNFSADNRRAFLRGERGAALIRRAAGTLILNGPKMVVLDPDDPAGRWLRFKRLDPGARDVIGWNTLSASSGSEQLTLCLIGSLAMLPAMLRRRAQIGGKARRNGKRRGGRRRRATGERRTRQHGAGWPDRRTAARENGDPATSRGHAA